MLSPLLSNVALSVLDELIAQAPGGPASTSHDRLKRRRRGLPSFRLIRFPDDWCLVVSGTRADAEMFKEQVVRGEQVPDAVVAVVGGPASGARVPVGIVARDHRQELGSIVVEAGIVDPELAADILHLVFRGYWLSSLEDPESWPGEAGARAALAIVDLLTKAA